MKEKRLAEQSCKAFNGDETPLRGKALEEMSAKLDDSWRLVEEHHLEKEYEMADFRQALDFTNAVGEIAEEEDHHPDIELGWGRVRLNLRTHKIDGLSENDFILAAKADRVFRSGWGS